MCLIVFSLTLILLNVIYIFFAGTSDEIIFSAGNLIINLLFYLNGKMDAD